VLRVAPAGRKISKSSKRNTGRFALRAMLPVMIWYYYDMLCLIFVELAFLELIHISLVLFENSNVGFCTKKNQLSKVDNWIITLFVV